MISKIFVKKESKKENFEELKTSMNKNNFIFIEKINEIIEFTREVYFAISILFALSILSFIFLFGLTLEAIFD